MLFEGTPCLAWFRGIFCVRIFAPYSCAVSWICFGSYCCLYPMTILMNGALSRIPWRVRYLARGTIERLKTRGVSPELCLCSCFQAETSKENVLVRLLRCCSHLQEPRDICRLFYVHFQTSPCLTHYASITIIHITCVPKTHKFK